MNRKTAKELMADAHIGPEPTGVRITENITCQRLASSERDGWSLMIGDRRTGANVEIRVTPSGQKVTVIEDDN